MGSITRVRSAGTVHLLLVVGIVTASTALATSRGLTSDSPRAASSVSESAKGPQTGGPLLGAIRQLAEKHELRPGMVMKKVFGDFRLGACRSGASTPPPTSWPAKGEPAIAYCKR
jgi:hypothetical protein